MASSVDLDYEKLFGCGSVAQMELSGTTKVQFLSVNLAFGFAVTAGAYVCAGVSGAHLNPAVSVAMYMMRKITWRMMLVYFVAQFIGAFLGAALVYLLYFDALNWHTNGTWTQETAGIFSSYPSEHLSIYNGLTDQVIATSALIICILAIIDESNMAPPRSLQPFIIGLVVLLVGLAMGFNCGYPINPARDLAPRIFTAICGWHEAFSAGGNWWWIPVLGPMVGGVLGTIIYLMCIQIHHPLPLREEPQGNSREEDPPRCYKLVEDEASDQTNV
ncbi:aquaporin-3-like [Hyperolius riggenbachi]|uniref:aquaporin-3-like n=1 Tax=Hyperolius riggenbachi TaxID=752182 RepID=UPI0035A27425